MKKLSFLGILTSILFFSCSKDNTTLLEPDFDVIVTGEAPNAQITITNNSAGATTYSWTLGEGASISISTDEAPSSIAVDKAGDLTIKLVVGNDSEEKELTKAVTITGNNAIVTYSDIEFGLDAGDTTYGRLYSFETGEVYLDSEVGTSNGSKMHLAFGSIENTMYFFQSPTDADYNVPDATETKVVNYESTPSISVTDFDSMADDSQLSGLTITETNDSFGNSSIPGTVLFEISTGKKGVIKTKAVNSNRLLVDIKIQKYASTQ